MATTVNQIESAQAAVAQLAGTQREAVKALAVALATWERMGFTTQDDSYRAGCRRTAVALAANSIAKGLLAGRVADAVVEGEIAERIDSRDLLKFRTAAFAEIAAVKAL